MADIEGSHTLEIDAPIEVCFDIAADVENAPDWQGAMKSAKALEHDDEGRPTLVDMEIDSGVTKNRLLLRFAYDEPNGMTWSRESGDLKSLEGRWTFEDLGDGRTEPPTRSRSASRAHWRCCARASRARPSRRSASYSRTARSRA